LQLHWLRIDLGWANEGSTDLTQKQIIAGSYLGLEGYIVEMSQEILHICQAISEQQVSWWHSPDPTFKQL